SPGRFRVVHGPASIKFACPSNFPPWAAIGARLLRPARPGPAPPAIQEVSAITSGFGSKLLPAAESLSRGRFHRPREIACPAPGRGTPECPRAAAEARRGLPERAAASARAC